MKCVIAVNLAEMSSEGGALASASVPSVCAGIRLYDSSASVIAPSLWKGFRRISEDYIYLEALQERLVLFWGWQESSENVSGSREPPEICCGAPALCGWLELVFLVRSWQT